MSLFRESTPARDEVMDSAVSAAVTAPVTAAVTVNAAQSASTLPTPAPAPRTSAFFQDADDSDSDDDIVVVEQVAAKPSHPSNAFLASEEMTISSDDDSSEEQTLDRQRSETKVDAQVVKSTRDLKRPSFDLHYFGGEESDRERRDSTRICRLIHPFGIQTSLSNHTLSTAKVLFVISRTMKQ